MVRVGVAAVDITPDYPIRLNGFGFRRTESEGVTQRIWAKALAFDSLHGPAVLIAVDNLGVPDALVQKLASRLTAKVGLPGHRLAVTATHTHTAPMLEGVAPTVFGQPIPEPHRQRIKRYTHEFLDMLERVALKALNDRRPATLQWGQATVDFAVNRRTPGGPVDHDLPVMVVKDPEGAMRAVYVSYACHCVTLSHNKISGDWAGFAQDLIQKRHPGAIALVSIGCGADANPSSGVVGDRVDVAADQGAQIADEVDRLLGERLTTLTAPLVSTMSRIDLPLEQLPDRGQWQQRAKADGPQGYHARVQLARLDRGESLKTKISYPIQSWKFGDQLAMVFLPGEVVVDYSLRLKQKFDGRRLWINAYSNDAPCYIPSERVLKEGGYEGGGAMIYYDVPTRFAPGLEEKIVSTVARQLGGEFAAQRQPGRQLPRDP